MDLPPLEQLVADDAWGAEHARFLHLVFVEFDRSGEWPVLEELVRKVARAGEGIDLYHEIRGLPPSLGRLEGERVTLMVRGLKPVDAAEALLGNFLAALRLAHELYLAEGPAVLRSSDVADRLDIDRLELAKVSWYLDREGFWFRGGSGEPEAGTWERDISGNIQRLADVRTIDDYLKAVARLQGFPVDQPATRVVTREQSLDSRTQINRADKWSAASNSEHLQTPAPASRSPSPERPGWRDDLTLIFVAGTFVVGAAGALATALGPGTASTLAVFIALLVVGLVAGIIYLRRNRLPRLSRRALVSSAAVAVCVAGLVGWLATRSTVSWAARADQICYDRGNQYLNATGSSVQRAQRRLDAAEAAQSGLEAISVPPQVQLQFNTVLADHRQIVGYLRQELNLAKQGRSTASAQNMLVNFYTDVYQTDAQALRLRDCGQETGYQ